VVLRTPHALFRLQGPCHPDRRRLERREEQLHRRLRQLGEGRRRARLRRADLVLPVGGLLPQGRLRRAQLLGPHQLGRLQGALYQDEERRPDPDRVRRQGRLARDGHLRHPEPAAERLRLPRGPVHGAAEVERLQGHGRLQEVGGDSAVLLARVCGPDLAAGGRPAASQAGRHVPARAFRVPGVSRLGQRCGPRAARLLPVPAPGHLVRQRGSPGRADRRVHGHEEVADLEQRPRPGEGVHGVPGQGFDADPVLRRVTRSDPHGQRRRPEQVRPTHQEGGRYRQQGQEDHAVLRPRLATRLRWTERHAAVPAPLPVQPDFQHDMQKFWDSLGPE
jgi:hypothetical protein